MRPNPFRASMPVNVLVGLLLLLTPALLIWQHFGMTQTIEISPRQPHDAAASDDRQYREGNSVSSLTTVGDAFVMRCTLGSAIKYPFCGLRFTLGSAGKGVDLSRFDTITINLRHDGNSPQFLAVHLLNSEPELFTRDDWNWRRVNEAEFEPAGQPSVTFPLYVLSTADWWLREHKLPLSRSYPRLDNVTMLELLTGSLPSGRVGTIALRSIQFRGKWISQADLLMYLVCAWIGCGVLGLARGLLHYRAGLAASDERLAQLAAINKALELETRELADQAQTDPLTGALNRQGLRAALMKRLRAAGEAGDKLAVIFMDLDHFKHVNDRHGHDAGDEVLRRFATLIRGATRDGDQLVRWGGEEFLLLCPGIEGEQAAQAAEKLRGVIGAAEWPHGLRLTSSFGATALKPDEDIGAAIARADGALYAAKAKGRNRVELA